MAQLNRSAAELMLDCGAHACTDVTGFGLIGHVAAMAAASGVDVEIVWDDLPLLPGVLECGREASPAARWSGTGNRPATGSRPMSGSSRPCWTCASIRRRPADC